MTNFLTTVSETEIREALLNEYKRKLLVYKLIDDQMTKKYNMDFAEFQSFNVVKENDYSWNVEEDSMEWEHSLDGIHTMQRKIKEILAK